jgi:hypothetical protein
MAHRQNHRAHFPRITAEDGVVTEKADPFAGRAAVGLVAAAEFPAAVGVAEQFGLAEGLDEFGAGRRGPT